MERPFDIITFDCYGTLIDWESGIADAFLDAAQKDGIALRRDDVLRAYEHHEPIVEHEQYRALPRRPHRLTALRVAQRSRLAARSTATFLPSRCRAGSRSPTRIPRWSACATPATASASSPMSTTTCSPKRGGTSPSTSTSIITAQQVGSYKPALGHFLRREGAHRLRALAARRAEQLPRRRAGERHGHPDGVGQSPRTTRLSREACRPTKCATWPACADLLAPETA